MFTTNYCHYMYANKLYFHRVLELQQVQKKDQDVSIIGQKLYQTQFEGREAEYKKLITQLERKVLKLLNLYRYLYYMCNQIYFYKDSLGPAFCHLYRGCPFLEVKNLML